MSSPRQVGTSRIPRPCDPMAKPLWTTTRTDPSRGDHPLGRPLIAEVDATIRDLRARQPWRLDVGRLVCDLGIRLTARRLGAHLRGLTLDERDVLIHSDLRGAQRSFVCAHEVAHVLKRRGHFASVTKADEEWFADWFARELVLPRKLLVAYGARLPLAALHVDGQTAALQLAAVGLAPRVMRDCSTVLCATCGARPHRWSCECRSFRRFPCDASSRLPDTRELGLFKRTCPESLVPQLAWTAMDSLGYA
jgi:hypothetical protein